MDLAPASEIIPIGNRVVIITVWAYGRVRGTQPTCDGHYYYIVELDRPAPEPFADKGCILVQPAALIDCGAAAAHDRICYTCGGWA